MKSHVVPSALFTSPTRSLLVVWPSTRVQCMEEPWIRTQAQTENRFLCKNVRRDERHKRHHRVQPEYLHCTVHREHPSSFSAALQIARIHAADTIMVNLGNSEDRAKCQQRETSPLPTKANTPPKPTATNISGLPKYLSSAEKVTLDEAIPPRPPVRSNASGGLQCVYPGPSSCSRGKSRFCGLYWAGLKRSARLITARGAFLSISDRSLPLSSLLTRVVVVVEVAVSFNVGLHSLGSTLAAR